MCATATLKARRTQSSRGVLEHIISPLPPGKPGESGCPRDEGGTRPEWGRFAVLRLLGGMACEEGPRTRFVVYMQRVKKRPPSVIRGQAKLRRRRASQNCAARGTSPRHWPMQRTRLPISSVMQERLPRRHWARCRLRRSGVQGRQPLGKKSGGPGAAAPARQNVSFISDSASSPFMFTKIVQSSVDFLI